MRTLICKGGGVDKTRCANRAWRDAEALQKIQAVGSVSAGCREFVVHKSTSLGGSRRLAALSRDCLSHNV